MENDLAFASSLEIALIQSVGNASVLHALALNTGEAWHPFVFQGEGTYAVISLAFL